MVATLRPLRPLTRLLAALPFAVPLVAQEPAPKPAVPDLATHVDHLFRRCTKPDAPGAVVLVARGDDVLHQRAYGLADIERQVPLTLDSVLDIGSTSKQFTAAAVHLLAIDGKLALSDAARKHVPELPECAASITLQQLMWHTSGLPDYIGLLFEKKFDVQDRATAQDALDALAAVGRLDFEPGKGWAYSNTNYFLLAEVVERTAAKPFAQFVQERLLTPAGMTATHVHDDCTRLVPRRALSYTPKAGGAWTWSFSNWEQVGDGAVFTTVGDLWKWARNFESGSVGGQALQQAMSRWCEHDLEGMRYGSGLMRELRHDAELVSHGGAWAAYRAELLRVPAERLVVIVLCNRDDHDPSQLARSIVDFVRGK